MGDEAGSVGWGCETGSTKFWRWMEMTELNVSCRTGNFSDVISFNLHIDSLW